MQSEEASRKLGQLDRELIERRIRSLLERRAAGDIRGMLEYFADDVVYDVKGSWTLFPYVSRRCGKSALAEMLRALHVNYENLGSEIHEIAIDGDRAAVHRTSALRHRGAGVVFNVGICNFLRFRDGLVVAISEYPDSAAMARLEAVAG